MSVCIRCHRYYHHQRRCRCCCCCCVFVVIVIVDINFHMSTMQCECAFLAADNHHTLASHCAFECVICVVCLCMAGTTRQTLFGHTLELKTYKLMAHVNCIRERQREREAQALTHSAQYIICALITFSVLMLNIPYYINQIHATMCSTGVYWVVRPACLQCWGALGLPLYLGRNAQKDNEGMWNERSQRLLDDACLLRLLYGVTF